MEDRRNQFTFYASYYDAIQHLKKQDQLAVIMAICAYAIYGTEPKLTGAAASSFILIKPTLDTSRRRAESGKRGGNAKQDASKEESNGKQSAREKEKEKEKEGEIEKEKEKEKESFSFKEKSQKKAAEGLDPDLSAFAPDLRTAVEQWLSYKAERREAYTPTSLDALLSQVAAAEKSDGAAAVAQIIRSSMASGFKGITFDRLSGYKNLARGNSGEWQMGEMELESMKWMMEKGGE